MLSTFPWSLKVTSSFKLESLRLSKQLCFHEPFRINFGKSLTY